ncbi:transcriptional regulator [Halocatena halophila]|uniref:transcriptional regulator n=1 Tax=Halocatena halophila TaxID=2814576 RepID=UPI002ED4DDA2
MIEHQDSESKEQFIPDFDEMDEHLDRRRKDILAVLRAVDNSDESRTINTSDLRRTAGVPAGSMTNHMQKLERWKLIECVGRAYVGGGSKAKVWQLTDRGREFCASHLDELRTFPAPEEVTALQNRLVELEGEVSEVDEEMSRLDSLENEVDQLRDVVMQIAVNTGTLSKEEARDAMGFTRYRRVFGD